MTSLQLFLSDVAGSEILLILVFILIFFGSKSIPGIARTMGKTIRQIKDASQEVQNEIKKSGGDMRKDFELQKIIDDSVGTIEEPFREQAQALDQSFSDSGVAFQPPPKFVNPMQSSETAPAKPLDQLHDSELVEETK